MAGFKPSGDVPTGVTTENGEWWPRKPPEFPVFSVGGKAPVRQNRRLPTILPVSQATTDLPSIIGGVAVYSARSRAKFGKGEFRRFHRQTARECGSVAKSRRRGITRISPVRTLAMGVPRRFLGASLAT